MRYTFAAFILATTAFTPALAADIAATSRIDAVTVFPDGADVTRVTTASLEKGEHRLLLNDLPGDIDPRSIRVEGLGGEGLDILSIDSRFVYLPSGSGDADRKAIEAEIEKLGDERSLLDREITNAEAQKTLLLSLADRQLSPTSTTEPVKSVDPASLGGLFDLVGGKLAAISTTIHQAQIRQRMIDRDVNDLQVKMAGLAPQQVARMEVAVNLMAEAATSGAFKVSYRIANAGWRPYYDARMALNTGDAQGKLELIRRAEVMQSTPESWDNVALTLSTARPSGATAAPDMTEQEIVLAYGDIGSKEESDAGAAGFARNALKMAAPEPMMEDAMVSADKPVQQKQATVEMAGFQANYVIADRVSVNNSGTAKKVRIGSDDYSATLNVVAVPRYDLSAYLTAAFTVKGEGPLLPGAVNLYRDGMYVGAGFLPLLNPAEEAKLGFGADDLIKVKRAEVKRLSAEEGIISSSHTETRAWDITVTNLHGFGLPVTVIDRIPFSASQDITVEPVAGMTPPTERDLNKRRGVMAWRFDLEPKDEKLVKTGFKVTWPDTVQVGQLVD